MSVEELIEKAKSDCLAGACQSREKILELLAVDPCSAEAQIMRDVASAFQAGCRPTNGARGQVA